VAVWKKGGPADRKGIKKGLATAVHKKERVGMIKKEDRAPSSRGRVGGATGEGLHRGAWRRGGKKAYLRNGAKRGVGPDPVASKENVTRGRRNRTD